MIKKLSVAILLSVLSVLALAVATLPSTDSVQMYVKNGNWSDTPVAVQGPYLAFSDLISGPDTGLGDGLGSGVIVTVWGYNLGSSQGSSTIQYCDSAAVCRNGHVYYWKNADGTLPGGPANLYESHRMQEIAFSIPDSATGAGTIRITKGGQTSTLPFTVRLGNIYHVKSTGNDGTGDGSFNNPWLTVSKADSTINAGSTLYVHTVLTGSETTDQVIYNNRAEAMSTLEAQFGYVAYPNTRPEAMGIRTFSVYAGGANNTRGFVMSKFSLFAAESDEDANGQPINQRVATGGTFAIEGSADGRAVGNYITDTHPSDTSGACPNKQQGAITAKTTRVSNFKIFGNHIEGYGCPGTNYQHHTMYLSIRDTTEPTLVAPEMGWNYLQDNDAKNGLHYFDEDLSGNNRCGQFSGTFRIHDNVVINQGGAGIFNGARCTFNTAFEYTNNILINTGLVTSVNATTGVGAYGSSNAIELSPGTNQTSTLTFKNNTMYQWWADGHLDGSATAVAACVGTASSADNISVVFDSNICYQITDHRFIGYNYQGSQLLDNFTGANNVWYTTVETPTLAITPTWDATPITTDPLITQTGSQLSIGTGSPVIDASSTTLTMDIYGTARSTTSNVGAVQ